MVWMVGLWLVAARFAIRGIVPAGAGTGTGRPAGVAAAA